jgi:hypothetical protein
MTISSFCFRTYGVSGRLRSASGAAVGHPTIEPVRRRTAHLTHLIVDTSNAWWEEWLQVHGPKLHTAGFLAESGVDPTVSSQPPEPLEMAERAVTVGSIKPGPS